MATSQESENFIVDSIQEEDKLSIQERPSILETNGQADSKVSMQEVKLNSVYFYLKYSTKKHAFEQYLERQLQIKKKSFTIVSFQNNEQEDIIEVEVQFSCMNEARRAQQHLSQQTPKSKMVISMKQLVNVSKIQKLRKSLEENRLLLLQKHRKKISILREKQRNEHIPEEKYKKLDLIDFEFALAKNKKLDHQITLHLHIESEFKRCYHNLQQELNEMESEGTGSIVEFERLIARECLRFQKALPIYARRQDIMKTVHDNQVVILIGETGSGKSTQVVQYLYDDGFAEQGCIVCTQPRKVAVVTLANYVTIEMCVPAGTLVGHCIGSTSATRKVGVDTKIIYMTDHDLLNECISDRLFSKYTCLVIDEAHERSLSTDMLLAFIKECLPYRPDLKVIIMSATINPDLFVQYFGCCPIVKVSGKTFPVDVIWNPLNSPEHPIQRKYVQDAMQIVMRIHNEEPRDGGILVFLTSPSETEHACEHLQHKLGATAIVLPLHGKLQLHNQYKVFQQNPGKRKIVISTNIAETSVTIPDIKYIVDTGLAKELCFDAKKNENSLEVCTISRSSAEQRKGRAGRVSSGKCYRLYSEEVYQTMQERTLPEILQVQLTYVILKLYAFGISNILAFNFIEMPDTKALLHALKKLHFIGAVENKNLTSFGQKLALLPVDAELGKILLDGVDAGIGYEAAVTVAVSRFGDSLFFRGGTEEMKAESDQKKIQFIHPGGDQLTSLVVYREWSSLRIDKRNQWCVENYINARSMIFVEETVKEFKSILSHNLHCTLSNIINIPNAEAKLPRIIFHAFLGNIAVYLGHKKLKYTALKTPGKHFLVFPGSSLTQMDQIPKYLIYERTLKLSQDFLLQVMPVEESWIEEAIDQNKLPSDLVKQLTQYLTTPLTVSNTEKKVLTSPLTISNTEKVLTTPLTVSNTEKKVLTTPLTVSNTEKKILTTPPMVSNTEKKVLISPLTVSNTEKKVLISPLTVSNNEKEVLISPLTVSNTEKDVLISPLTVSNTEEEVLIPPLMVSNIGQKVYDHVFKKSVQSIQDEIAAITQNSLVKLECRPELGFIRVYINFCCHTIVKELLEAKLRRVRDEMKVETTQEIVIRKLQNDVRVVLGSGGTVQHIFMPYHYCTVVVKGPFERSWIDQMKDLLSEYGSIVIASPNFLKNQSHLYITFSNQDAAFKATKMIHLQEDLDIQPVYPYNKVNIKRHNNFTLQIKWGGRKRSRILAFLQFQSVKDAQFAHASLPVNVVTISIPGIQLESRLKFQPSENDPTKILVGNIPPRASAEDIRKSVENYLLGIQFEVKLFIEKPFVTIDEEVGKVQDQLKNIISKYSSQSQYKIKLSVPTDHSCKFQAFVEFINPQEGLQAFHGLQYESINGEEHTTHVMMLSSIRCISEVYQVVKNEIDSVATKLHTKYKASIIIQQEKDDYGNVFIMITATEVTPFTKAMTMFNNIALPSVIECQSPTCQHYIMSHTCRQLITKIQAATSTYIYTNLQTMTIDIYGAELNRKGAFSQVREQIQIFEGHGFLVHQINLKAPGIPPGLMKYLVTEFGTDLHGIIEKDGVEYAILDPRRQILTVFAKDDGVTKIKQIRDHYITSVPTTGLQRTPTENQPECCVCLCDIENIRDIIRLEYCGHPYHIECMKLQVSQNTLTIPLLCAAEDCSQQFIWQDFETLFKTTPLTLQILVEASLRSYLVANRDKLRNCLTPDCKMIYAVTENGQRFICSHCSVHICTTCHVQYHDGLTCEMYKVRR